MIVSVVLFATALSSSFQLLFGGIFVNLDGLNYPIFKCPNTFPSFSAVGNILFKQALSNFSNNISFCFSIYSLVLYLFLLISEFVVILTRLFTSALDSSPNHLCAYVLATISVDSVKLSMVIYSLVFFLFLFISFIPHKALNITRSLFVLKIATLSFRHYVSLPYGMVDDTTQLW